LGIKVKFARRRFLQLAAGAALPAWPRAASAADYPVRPVHLLVGFSAGSASDIIARLLAQKMSEQLGQPVVVENRPGAATNLAAETVVRAQADGYTLLLATSTNAVNTTLYQHLSFNFSTDIAPVALIDLVPYVLEVTPSLPAKTLPEFIAYAKANPGKINMASNGVGSGPHVAGELFKMMAGVDLVHVPYTGNPYSDLIGGQVQVMFSPIPASIGYVRSGQLRPLAVGSTTRIAVLPDVPTVAEFLPG
jgi:tripartite-type tricarboxylate transporter receptor subunit TctC